MILFRISFGKNEAVVEVGTEWRLVERLLAAALGRVETGCPASLMVVACPPGGRARALADAYRARGSYSAAGTQTARDEAGPQAPG